MKFPNPSFRYFITFHLCGFCPKQNMTIFATNGFSRLLEIRKIYVSFSYHSIITLKMFTAKGAAALYQVLLSASCWNLLAEARTSFN